MAGGTIDLGLVRGPNQITTDTSTTISGILKGDGSGHAAAAAAGTDYVAPSDLASISATGTTNTTGAAIGLGTFFYLNNDPVYAIQTIDVGATFSNGTNYAPASSGVANELRKSHIDTAVDLSGYSTSLYIFPSDGYLYVAAKGGSSYIIAAVYGSGGEAPFATSAQGNSVSGSYFANSVFVRVGMRMMMLQSSGDTLARFYGLK